jgi:hypothetical protein
VVANLFDPPGTPLGTAHHAERDLIRAHLRRRLWRFYVDEAGPGTPGMRLEARVDAIQRRLHKYDLTLRERQAIARAKAPPPAGTSEFFTWEEFDRLAEHFAGANDPVAIAIGEKALAALARRPERP